jgi:N-acetyl-anhydromuramyl-L-alanine amidase AmpD
MTDINALPFIPAAHYTRGRTKPLLWVVLHSAEGARLASELGNYFHTTTRSASSHIGVGQDGKAAQYVHDNDTAYAAVNANNQGWHVELCGFAHWTRTEWLAHRAMLDTAAACVAKICQAYHIRAAWLTPADLEAGHSGLTTHRTVSAWKPSTGHTDPGPDFPLDVFLALVQHHLAPADWHKDGYTHPTLKEGASGREVIHLQTLLNRHGAHLAADGKFGAMTTSAVKSFQRLVHVAVDGVVGPNTWLHLHTA